MRFDFANTISRLDDLEQNLDHAHRSMIDYLDVVYNSAREVQKIKEDIEMYIDAQDILESADD